VGREGGQGVRFGLDRDGKEKEKKKKEQRTERQGNG
jgi:hypothetical protein